MNIHPSIKRFSAVLLIVLFTAAVFVLLQTKPDPKRRFKPPQAKVSVHIQELTKRTVPIVIRSYGLVEPLIQTQLVTQVGGKIDYIDEDFREGGFFSQDQALLKIEQVDYQVEIDVTYANLVDAQRLYQQEKALAAQAELDWRRSGNTGLPPDLVLRKPQLSAAEANLRSAEARYKKAKINLQRTQLLAPYNGRVLIKHVDLGEVVSANTPVANIYAIDAVEIRLPINNNELEFITLPEDYLQRGNDTTANPKVTIYSKLSGEDEWHGYIVRTAGAIDENSRQLSVIARIEDPFGEAARGKIPLKIRQYVTADIEGKQLHDVITIPNSSIYQGSYVYLYEDGVVMRREIKIRWQDAKQAIVEDGLNEGDKLVLTALGRLPSGTPVQLSDRHPKAGSKHSKRAAQEGKKLSKRRRGDTP